MDLLKARREQKRQEREDRIGAAIERVSASATAKVIEQFYQGVPPYIVNLGRTPRGIVLESYIERVRSDVDRRLGGVGLAGEIELNLAKTSGASVDIISVVPGFTEPREKRDGITLIFDRLDVSVSH